MSLEVLLDTYKGVVGYRSDFSANQVGRPKILWVMREYGL